MFRVKLSIALAIFLTIILALAAILYWGTQRTEYYFQRSQLANTALEAYAQLSHNAYRHFKELLDIVVLSSDANSDDTKFTYQALQHSMNKLKNATDAEISWVEGSEEEEDEKEELTRVAKLEALLLEGIQAFDQVMILNDAGAQKSAQSTLSQVLEETIDQEFRPLIDAAINHEREEVEEAKQRIEELINELKLTATITAVAATCFALLTGLFLLRNLSTPLSVLVTGVRNVAKGDLNHRISLPGHNEFTYLAKNFNDMTAALAQQHQQLLAAQTELENKVQARTYDLQKVNNKLLHIDEGRRRFFADISHELRTPLTAIRGEAEVTIRGKNKSIDEYLTALRRIVDLSAQLAQLVDDLLFLARSESASMRFNLCPIKLDELLRNICHDIQALAHNKQLELILDTGDQPLPINGDVTRLRQLLLILIDNACRYSNPNGKININLKTHSTDVIIEVIDQGIGIMADELDYVFERFTRGNAARKLAPSGSGLGLPLAKSIVDGHHGQIKLTSAPDQGTKVTITLPTLQRTDKQNGDIDS